MSNNHITSPECTLKEQSEINEPSDPQLAIEELRRLVKGK